MASSEKDILQEIRDEFEYYENEWRDIREEAKKDMRYIAGDPWDPNEKQIRKDADRPCLAFDELSQFVNQLLNDPKQNPRAIKINPKGDGANATTAHVRESLIRDIQYNSRAQAAFTTGFQGSVQRSYGFWRAGSRYMLDGTGYEEGDTDRGSTDLNRLMQQELYIGRIPNPDSVLIHPNYKELDASDMAGCFVVDKMRKEDFKKKYSWAKVTDFTANDSELAPQWIDSQDVMVAEYWKVDTELKTLYLVDAKGGPLAMWKDELPKDFNKSRIKRERKVDFRKVIQYETNGVEILNETEVKIPWIPIIPCFGEELWLDESNGSRRHLYSLIRRARDPYMYYCFIRSSQAELVGMTPKTPWIGVTGQFETNKDDWQMANKIPKAYLQYDMVLDSTGAALPPPQRQPYDPQIQGLEILAEGARRAIQAAMGITPLPTAAQRNNEKSGIALQQIDSQEDRGSFGFIDNYNIALEHTGRVLNAWVPIVYDTPMEVGVREADESHRVIRINDPDYQEPDDNGQPVKTHYDAETGEHGVTVSTGPNFESQREESSDFVNLLIQHIDVLPIMPDAKAHLLSLAVKLKNIGPLGDEISEIIYPPPDKMAQQQQMQQGQMALQQSAQVIQELQAELQKLQLEKAGKVIQGETQKQIQTMKNDIDVLKALLASKQDIATQEMEMFKQFWVENHGAAHELGMQAVDQQHQAAMAAQGQAADAQQQQQAQQAEAANQATQSQPGSTVAS